MADSTLVVKQYTEFLRACDLAGREAKKQVRGTLRKVGDVVRVEWSREFAARYDARSASGYRTRVRLRGIAVEQSYRKTTGTRSDYGHLQQKVGESILAAKRREIETDVEHALDEVADFFERR